jgi:hypothetical protein
MTLIAIGVFVLVSRTHPARARGTAPRALSNHEMPRSSVRLDGQSFYSRTLMPRVFIFR